MPLFTYPPTPLSLEPDGTFVAATSTAVALPAGSAVFAAVELRATVTITQMRCLLSGSPTGNIDMGVYDASGTNNSPNNLLGHTGANAAATGIFTKSLTANLTLSPGEYWLALLDTVADTAYARGATLSGAAPIMKTSATNLTVLPSTASTVANYATLFSVLALLQNSWS